MKVFFAKDNTIFDGLFYVNNEVSIPPSALAGFKAFAGSRREKYEFLIDVPVGICRRCYVHRFAHLLFARE